MVIAVQIQYAYAVATAASTTQKTSNEKQLPHAEHMNMHVTQSSIFATVLA